MTLEELKQEAMTYLERNWESGGTDDTLPALVQAAVTIVCWEPQTKTKGING
jgi:hypothetical protein